MPGIKRHKTDFQIKSIMKYNRDGSPNLRQTRHQNLMRFVKHMQDERGYSKRWDVRKIGKKEVYRYVNDLKQRGLNYRTIANNLKDIRWLAEKVGRADQMPTNRECGLKKREYSMENKAVQLTPAMLSKMDERMQLINRLKREFGLREKEALKFGHKYATATPDKIQLKDTWCKNGRSREIPIVNDTQVQLLQEVGRFQKENGDYSMIPRKIKFSTYRDYVQDKSKELGFKGHGLRHAWAHERFKQLSGMDCPIADGPRYSELGDEEKERWDYAAGVVNQELGHGKDRLDTTATYIGVRYF